MLLERNVGDETLQVTFDAIRSSSPGDKNASALAAGVPLIVFTYSDPKTNICLTALVRVVQILWPAIAELFRISEAQSSSEAYAPPKKPTNEAEVLPMQNEVQSKEFAWKQNRPVWTLL